MTFGSRQNLAKGKLQLAYAGQPIENVSKFKYLGVTVDENLCWNNHIDDISNKISRRLGVLKRVSSLLDINTAKLLFNSLILPIFDYCD